MATDFDRDDPIDRLLENAERRDVLPLPVGEACLDAETLAAWSDAALTPDEAQNVEAHLAGCARCQAMAAAMARMDAPPLAVPAPARARFDPRVWGTLAAGILAATFLTWRIIFTPEIGPQQGSTDAAHQATAPSASEKADARPEPTPSSAGDLASAGREQRIGPAKPAAPAPAESARQDAVSEVPLAAPGKGATRGAPSTPPPPARATAPPPPLPAGAVTAPPVQIPPPATQTAAAQQGQQGAAASRTLAETVTFRAEPAIVAEFSSIKVARDSTVSGLPTAAVAGGRAGGGGAGRGGAGGGGRVGGVAAKQLALERPAPPAYWRIRASGVVERSTDAIAWSPVALPQGTAGLTNGAAPSPSVCWLVGRAGLVLLSTDGQAFARVASPVNVDLASITAVDALQATVTTTDGRTFTTKDGGKTWND